MKKITKYIILIIAISISAGCDKSDTDNPDVETEILNEMQAENVKSVAACIVNRDSIVWEGTFGYANLDQSQPTSRLTLYTIMSLGKLFLSIAVMQLWEQGLIDLDADINQYLPFEVRNPYYPDKKITSYMLLNHCSGLAWPADKDHIPDFHHFYTSEDPPHLTEWLPEFIIPGGSNYRKAAWKDFAPGENRLYSNFGTSVLGLVVKEISGLDYRDYCRHNIFLPLDMEHTHFRLGDLDHDLMAQPYYDNGYPMEYYSCRHYPAGFMSSNLEDYSHFLISILNKGEYKGKRIIQESTFDKMMEIQNPEAGLSNLWWHNMGNSVGHTGGGTGFSTCVEWNFDDRVGMIIFSNKVNSSVYPGGRIYELVRYKARDL